jgi:hypothetical protein
MYKDVSVGGMSPRVEQGRTYTATDFKRMGFYQDVAADELMPDEKPAADLLPDEKPTAKPIPASKPAEELLPDDVPAKTPAATGPKKPAAKSPFLEEEEPKKVPTPDTAYDEVPGKAEPLAGPDVDGGCVVGCGNAGCDAACGSTCGGRKSTFRNRLEDCYGIKVGAWLDQGITANYHGSADRFNGPVTFNDREGEYQMNQAYFYAERATKTDGCGWDLGGRVDFLYGTDWRFIQSQGLENRWNSERFYGAALPQAYADVAFNDWVVRMGKFNTIMGYEVIGAPGNFFYSHSYMMQYAEPMTQTGLLASRKLGDTLTVSGGFDRGWDKWEDNNDRLEFLGKVAWTSCDERTSLAFALTSGPWDDAGQLNRTAYSLVFTHKFNCRFSYVVQHDLGVDNDGGLRNLRTGERSDAQWYGINQYFFYEINPCWAMGLRFEWFRDQDGTRVGGIGEPHGWALGPNFANNQIGWAGNFYELTAGVNWKPRERLIVRPELRWDWYSGNPDGLGRLPYNTGERSQQFTFATDIIIKF